MSDIFKKINSIIEEKIVPIIKEKGFEVFEVKTYFAVKKINIKIVIDYSQGGILLDNCAEIGRIVDTYIEENNLIDEAYVIEVCSPGLDWELKNPKDFRRIIGRKINLWLSEKINDKVQYNGVIKSVNENAGFLVLETKDGEKKFLFSLVKKGKEEIEF